MIKPLSVNKCFAQPKGTNRFKTKEYKAFEEELRLSLPNIEIPKGVPLFVFFQWGMSNYGSSDVDNPTKPAMDVISARYGFNDKQVCTILLDKIKVPKGEEFLRFFISTADDPRLLDYLTNVANRCGELMNSHQKDDLILTG